MSSEHELVVEEAIGPPIEVLPAAAAIYLGSLSLLMVGVMPALLGALADAGRLSDAGIGLCATFESLMIAISAGLCGAFVTPARLHLLAGLSALALALLDLATMPASGVGVMI